MKKTIFIFLITLSANAFSQSMADSIYFYQQSTAAIKAAQANATFLLNSNTTRLGLANIKYELINGGFRSAQQAQKTTNGAIYSEGINTFGRFKVSGYFSFRRTWQDSLAWSTKGLEQDDQPYFYASKKAGEFERQNYDLGGILSYNIIKDKLYIASGLSYMYNSATRSVDPRPQVNTFRLKLMPELVYKYGKSSIGLGGKYGYGDETVAMVYKNTDFSASLGYPDRINYLVQGYGLINISQGTSTFKRNNQYFGLGLNYAASIGQYNLKSSIAYNFDKEGTYQVLASSLSRIYMGYYYTDQISFFTQVNKETPTTAAQLHIDYQNKNSNDANFMLYAINYRFKQNYLDAGYLLRINKKQKLSPEFGIRAIYNDVAKTDFSTDHFISYTWIEPTLNGTIYYQPNQLHKLAVGLGLGLRQALKDNIAIPETQLSVFTNGVVFPDFTYNTSSALKMQGNIKYISGSLFKQFKTGLSSNFTYYRKIDSKNIFPTATQPLGKSLLHVDFSLNLYF